MGRSSVDATKAFLIRAVRAIRWALVPRRRALRRMEAALEAVPRLPAVLPETFFFV
jgi:hypothetical protein